MYTFPLVRSGTHPSDFHIIDTAFVTPLSATPDRLDTSHVVTSLRFLNPSTTCTMPSIGNKPFVGLGFIFDCGTVERGLVFCACHGTVSRCPTIETRFEIACYTSVIGGSFCKKW